MVWCAAGSIRLRRAARMSMKTRSFFSILAALVLVLLLSGVAGAYWLVANNPLTRVQGVAPSAQAGLFVSRQAPIMVSLLVNPDRLAAVDVLTTAPAQRRQVQRRWQQLRQEVLGRRQLDYDQDIRPWLGEEITLAVTSPDLDRNPSNGQQTGYLVAAAIKDPQQAEQSIQAYWQRQASRGLNLVFEQYAGVKILYGREEVADELSGQESRQESGQASQAHGAIDALPLATAVVGDRFVLFANHPKVLRDAINTFQVPDLNLENTESYQQAMQHLSGSCIGVIYTYLPQLAAWLGDSALPPADAPRFDSLVMALNLDEAGVVGDALLLAPGVTLSKMPPEANSGQALNYIPPVAPVALTGRDLYQQWTGLEAGATGYDSLKSLLEQPLDSWHRQWQIEVTEDVFPWVDGEYALALLPNATRTEGDWLFVAERTPTFISGLTQLDEIAQQQGATIGHLKLADQPVTAWTSLSVNAAPIATTTRQRQAVTLEATVQGVHTTVGEYELFATSLDTLAQAIQADHYSLPTNEAFRQSIARLPTPNQGYIYLDWQRLPNLGSWASRIQQRVPPIAQSLLDNVRSVTISTDDTQANAVHSVVFVRL